MKVLAIGRVNLLRFVRDRSNIFFVFVFPMLLILMLGLLFGGEFSARVAVAGSDRGPLAGRLTEQLSSLDQVELDLVSNEPDAIDRVERGISQAGVVIPDDYDQRLARGERVTVRYVFQPDSSAQSLQATVQAAVDEQNVVLGAAAFAQDHTDAGFEEAVAVAAGVSQDVPPIAVSVSAVGESQFEELAGLGRFDLGASSQLILFMFLTSLAGSSALIQTRQLGVTKRMVSTPTGVSSILAGEATGRFLIAGAQGLYIVFGSLLIFRVDWGDPVGAMAIVGSFALVGAGAAMLMGSLFKNDQQAGGMGVFLGLGLAALGGSMVPIEIFPEGLQSVARITPHFWANQAFAELVRRGGGLADITPELAVLLGYGVVLLIVSTWLLRKSVVTTT